MNDNVKILIVDDEMIVRESMQGWLEEDGYHVEVAETAEAALGMIGEKEFDMAFVDIKMPGIDGIELLKRLKDQYSTIDVVMMTAYASVNNAVEAMKIGAYDYLTKPFDPDYVSMMVRKIIARRQLEQENIHLKENIETALKHVHIIGESSAIKAILNQIEEVAPSDTSVLIAGESGTGKEMIARAIHYASPRRFEPLVVVSCGALPEGLVESELFGYERGAFTGAFYKKKGKFEAANGGTLFLDEIGELNPKMQVDLLRVLQEREITRIGSNKSITVDFRVLAASNRNLKGMVDEGKFREDLFYRINVFNIHVPTLRERMEDIPFLVEHFISTLRRQTGKQIEGITAQALNKLKQHGWPGNVRELQNAVERAFVTSKGKLITTEELAFLAPEKIPVTTSPSSSLAEIESMHIENVLKECDYNISMGAKVLGIDRTTLYNKMKKYGIEK
ncbi:MAG: Fis family transcriptional regulator [Acidobacteria bacterium CG_4_9_14_3_um_filter_49_7]|nr:MAG: Fis family transcriptional regulator [Acidobacteria bacterium CG_4_9_14_3_um_filter_49_7]